MKKAFNITYGVFKIVSIFCWFLLLFLMTINFQDEIDQLFEIFFYYSIGLGIIFRHKFNINFEIVVLLLFANIYYFIFIDYNGFHPWSYTRVWTGASMMYFAGKMFMTQQTKKYFPILLLTFALGLFTYASLNMHLYITGDTPDGARVAYDFWAGHPIGATLMAAYYIAIGSLLFYALFYIKVKTLYINILLLVAIFIGAYHNILLSNRTYFVILFFTFIAMFPIHIVFKKKKALIELAGVALIIGIVYTIYKTDVFSIMTVIESTRWFTRMEFLVENGLTADPRFSVYRLVWPQIFTYPLGGYQMDLGGLTHAHNLWMDVLFTAGPYPFFLLIGYTVLILSTLGRVLINKQVHQDTKVILFSIYLGMHLYFMVEPILDGVPYVFSMFCIINGATYSYLRLVQTKDQIQKLI